MNASELKDRQIADDASIEILEVMVEYVHRLVAGTPVDEDATGDKIAAIISSAITRAKEGQG